MGLILIIILLILLFGGGFGYYRPDRDTARRDLFAYIEGYYNRRRIHSAIGYFTPQQAEARYA
jgi:transposase InsO family protein